MKVEQAIFTSAQTSRMQGYQLVSRSPGINNVLSQELYRWGPSQASLVGSGLDDWSLNCFPATGQQVAVSRTVYGGPEYSGRGGLQTVTFILVLQRDQLYGYDYNPLNLAHTAQILGHMRLPKKFEDQLLPLELPERLLYATQYRAAAADHTQVTEKLAGSISTVLRQGGRTAIIGETDPVGVIDGLLQRTPLSQRTKLSFTTGLKPSLQRRFQIHFLPQVDLKLNNELAAQGITRIDVS